MKWTDIAPADALDIDCTTRPDLDPPRDEFGEVCPWPWGPQQLVGAPLGMYHCPYCGSMVVAGVQHPDYGPGGMQGPGPTPPGGIVVTSVEGWPPEGEGHALPRSEADTHPPS